MIARPKKGEPPRPTLVKSIRLPPAVWQQVEQIARQLNKTPHTVLRDAVDSLVIRAKKVKR